MVEKWKFVKYLCLATYYKLTNKAHTIAIFEFIWHYEKKILKRQYREIL